VRTPDAEVDLARMEFVVHLSAHENWSDSTSLSPLRPLPLLLFPWPVHNSAPLRKASDPIGFCGEL
jgi:hypothetical protein